MPGRSPAAYILPAPVAALNAFTWLLLRTLSTAATSLSNLLPRWLRWDITLSAVTVGAESVSAALEQTSAHKLKAAEYGIVMVTVSLIVIFADLAYKYKRRGSKRTIIDNHHREGSEWDFEDRFGLVSSVLTLLTASINYHYLKQGKQQLIQFSILPLAFSTCVFCSCIFRPPLDNRPTFVMRCPVLGAMHLQIIDVEKETHGRDGSVKFDCPVCKSGRIHPLRA